MLLPQVRDLVSQYHNYKFEFRLMYEHRLAGGEMPPHSATEKVELLKKKLVQQHEQSEWREGCMCVYRWTACVHMHAH